MSRPNDPGYRETDRVLERMEKKVTRAYAQAHKEVSAKLDDYLRRFEKKDDTWRRWVAEGKKTAAQYKDWRRGQLLIGKRWEEMKETLATDLQNASKIARSAVNGYIPEVYAINHNYATYEVENGAHVDTSYTLYNRETVERLWREDGVFYHAPGEDTLRDIALGKQKAWDRDQIQSVMTQGILQGESIVDLTKRLERVTGGDHAAAIRNARTMVTGVQNAGRMDAYQRMEDKGIKLKKTWMATMDGRTRHAHRELDGVSVDLDEKFENEFGEIDYPGDPEADSRNVYNCRCCLVSEQEGYEVDWSNLELRNTDHLGDMTYEEWKESREETSNPIDAPEKRAEAYKWTYIREYREL